ncbi:MAG: SPASM domain-containing protein [Leptospiraceae bacterium]|nr:SPASM domain-containing protein [Leptospiraceae bacterium]MDW7976562.1 SPASM domain-containing protein [Leptospiraceae bacterium]
MWEANLKDRTLEAILIRNTLSHYDEELVYLFFQKLERLITNLKQKLIRKKFSIIVPQPLPVYLIDDEKNFGFFFDGFEVKIIQATSLKEAVEKIFPDKIEKVPSEEEWIIDIPTDFFLYFEAISPFLEVDDSVQMILEHCTYLAEYSYCDVAIPGFLPVVCNVELAKRITIEGEDFRWNWNELMLKNTQTVDLEIYYLEPDYRKYRIRLDLHSEREQKIVKNIYKKYKNFRYQDLELIITKEIELLRIAPNYVEIEITTKNELKPVIYPHETNSNEMEIETFQKILSDLQEFSLHHAISLSFAGKGDPFLNENFLEFLKLSYESRLFRKVYIETYLTTWKEDILELIQRHPRFFFLIIKLPTLNENLYSKLMGKNLFSKVKKNLLELPKDITIYVEILRIKQVEDELDFIFKEFSQYPHIKPFIGRYFTYGGILEDYSVVDLEPIEKDYCRSLMFHVFIDAKGNVPVCRQDLFCRNKHWNIKEHNLKDIFKIIEKDYYHFLRQEYDEIIPLCRSCKDWFVYLE